MNRTQRFRLWAASLVAPDLRRTVETQRSDLRAARTLLAANEALQSEQRNESQRRRAEMREAYDLMGSGPEMCAYIANAPVNVHEAAHGGDKQLRESLWELELALEDRGWQRQLALAATEFSRYGIQQLILMSRLYLLKNPLIKRGVYVSAYYVFGRGIEITSDDDAANDAIKAFLADPQNAKEFGHSGLLEKHNSFQTDGNLFFAFFTEAGTGNVRVRTIDATEILDKITDPDDSSVDWYYRRNWSPIKFDPSAEQGYTTSTRIDEWYPAKGYDPPAKPDVIGGKKVNWDVPVKHLKGGSIPKWKFGCPWVYAAINDARAYVDFLKDWCTINRMMTRFSWDLEQPGGSQAIGAASTAFSTTLGVGGSSIEQNPPPTVGAAFVHSPGTKMSPIKTANAVTGPEEARRILLNVAAAFGLPETFFGDASTGSLATAQSLDRPTELKFLAEQELWREALQDIFTFPLEQSIRGPKGTLREAFKGKKIKVMALQPTFNSRGEKIWSLPTKEAREAKELATGVKEISVIVNFPSILEHDIAQRVTAIVQASTLGGFDPAGTVDFKTMARLLNNEIGSEDFEKDFEAMFPNYNPQVGNGDGQPEQDAATVGAVPQSKPKLPVPSFGAESARWTRMLAEALTKMETKGKL